MYGRLTSRAVLLWCISWLINVETLWNKACITIEWHTRPVKKGQNNSAS